MIIQIIQSMMVGGHLFDAIISNAILAKNIPLTSLPPVRSLWKNSSHSIMVELHQIWTYCFWCHVWRQKSAIILSVHILMHRFSKHVLNIVTTISYVWCFYKYSSKHPKNIFKNCVLTLFSSFRGWKWCIFHPLSITLPVSRAL